MLSLSIPVTALVISVVYFGLGYTLAVPLLLGVLLLALVVLARFLVQRRLPRGMQETVAFFHPNANGGGGGERVLWCAVCTLQSKASHAKIVLFTCETLSEEEQLASVKARFNLDVQPGIKIVHLLQPELLWPEHYPRFTLIGQALGSVQLAYQALKQLNPEVFVDTSGWAFTYPLARLAGARVACYVHYPTISTDMLDRVYNRTPLYNNNSEITSSLPKSMAKLVYYHIFAFVYGLAGTCAQVVMVNSSWTRDHIRSLWWNWHAPIRVYPPCDTDALQRLPLDRKLKRLYLVSVAQFRPEKNHLLQLQAFAMARAKATGLPAVHGEAILAAKLQLIGSSRGHGDDARVEELRKACQLLGLADHVEFCINVPYLQLQQLLGAAVGGLHTMVDEHFGISVVEYMAAGVVPIANDSGGPQQDIVGPRTGRLRLGYLCSELEEYADAIMDLLSMDQLSRLRLTEAARRKAAQFSDANFAHDWCLALQPIL